MSWDSDPTSPANARTAIENLMFLYSEAIDAGDFAAIGELFARGRMLAPDGGISGEGRDGVRAIYDQSTKLFEDGTPKTQHVNTNLIFEFDADGRGARVRSRFTVFQALPDFPLQPIITGHYADTFAYFDGSGSDGSGSDSSGTQADGWYFVERAMRPVLLGDLSRHLKYELPAS